MRFSLCAVLISAARLAVGVFCLAVTVAIVAGEASTPPAGQLDQHTLDKRTKPILKALGLESSDSARAAHVRTALEQHLQAVQTFHEQHKAELAGLWQQWSRARTPPQKDEARAAEIGREIDAVYAQFRASHDAFLAALARDLSPHEIDVVEDAMTAKPGLKRTYEAYLEMVPALTEPERREIHQLLEIARDEAIDATDDDKGAEKINLFKKQKIKVQAFLDAHGYDYEKSYKAWVEKLRKKTKD